MRNSLDSIEIEWRNPTKQHLIFCYDGWDWLQVALPLSSLGTQACCAPFVSGQWLLHDFSQRGDPDLNGHKFDLDAL
jgi:hypothetical protein